VFREWHRHRTQSYNEMSGRYTELPDLYYIPSIERLMAGKQSTSNKQSSELGFDEFDAQNIQLLMRETAQDCRESYEFLLKRGVSRELARLVLPVNQYSRMRASANLRNWLGFLALRMDEAAQWEIRQYANAVADLVKQNFPRTYELFEEGSRGLETR
jgi:thymidylate synthase (FAD)